MRAGHAIVAGVDEVGRGALAGPVSVGVVLVDLSVRSAPVGLRDSKLLAPVVREQLAPRLRRWALDHAVGHAEAVEIDEIGILPALRLAGLRALGRLRIQPDCVLLDGSYDWLHRPAEPEGLFSLDSEADLGVAGCDTSLPPVHIRIKADLTCAAVAAASVIAKTERDAMMVQRAVHHPAYGWAGNKGYSAPEHIAALRAQGVSSEHRRSWRLPGIDAASTDAVANDAVPIGAGPVGAESIDIRTDQEVVVIP